MIGLLLAGGEARRMGGGDKGRRMIGSISILERVAVALRGQCSHLVLNANGDPARFEDLGLPVVGDTVPNCPGPLAGLLAGLDYVAGRFPNAASVVTVPTDSPYLPADLVQRLVDTQGADDSTIVCAGSGRRSHFTTALWPVALRQDLRRVLCDEDVRKVSAFVGRHSWRRVEWPLEPYDPFFNVNAPEDLEEAEHIAALIDEHDQHGSAGEFPPRR